MNTPGSAAGNGNNKVSTIEIKPYTHMELSNLYGISKKTLTKWLRPFQEVIGKRNGNIYNVRQVESIIQSLGYSYKVEDE